MNVLFFATPAELQAWFADHHNMAEAQWIGFHKKDSGRPSITWPEAVDEALCVGWIDGVRKRLDDQSYMIRFTPRKLRSTWSVVNIKRVEELTNTGRMQPAGLAAFAQRTTARSGTYAYEQTGELQLAVEDEQLLRANGAAWEFWHNQPPSYRRTATWWIMSAKQATTRQKRLATLIADSAAGRTLRQFSRTPKQS